MTGTGDIDAARPSRKLEFPMETEIKEDGALLGTP